MSATESRYACLPASTAAFRVSFWRETVLRPFSYRSDADCLMSSARWRTIFRTLARSSFQIVCTFSSLICQELPRFVTRPRSPKHTSRYANSKSQKEIAKAAFFFHCNYLAFQAIVAAVIAVYIRVECGSVTNVSVRWWRTRSLRSSVPEELWNYALRLLAGRPYSVAELKTKLSRRSESAVCGCGNSRETPGIWNG